MRPRERLSSNPATSTSLRGSDKIVSAKHISNKNKATHKSATRVKTPASSVSSPVRTSSSAESTPSKSEPRSGMAERSPTRVSRASAMSCMIVWISGCIHPRSQTNTYSDDACNKISDIVVGLTASLATGGLEGGQRGGRNVESRGQLVDEGSDCSIRCDSRLTDRSYEKKIRPW